MELQWYIWVCYWVPPLCIIAVLLGEFTTICQRNPSHSKARIWAKLFSFIPISLDWICWYSFIFFRKTTWQWIGRGFPRLKAHYTTDGRITVWVIAIVASLGLVYCIPKLYAGTLPKNILVTNEQGEHIETKVNLLEKESEFRVLIVQVAGGILLLLGLNRGWQELRMNREGQLTDRFTQAVDQLGNENLDIRLGGVFALERIARDYREYHWTVMEVFTAYVREHSPWPPSGWRLTKEDAAYARVSFPAQDLSLPHPK